MLLPSWWKRSPRATQPIERDRARKTGRRCTNALPRLEALEDRLAPALTLTAVSFANVFNASLYSAGAPAVDAAGNVYDTTQTGGANGTGSVIEWAKSTNAVKTIASFPSAAGGSAPVVNPGLVFDDGTLYGTTVNGGEDGVGSVFSVPSGGGSPATVDSFDFNTKGGQPGALLLAGGTLYGTARQGGASNDGTVYSVSNGSIMPLASFDGNDGASPNDGLAFSNGILYGTTAGPYGSGVVFSLPAAGGTITDMAGGVGGGASGGLVVDPNGNVFGAEGDEIFEAPAGSTPNEPVTASHTLDSGGSVGTGILTGLINVGGRFIGGTDTGAGGPQVHHGALFSFDPVTGTVNLLTAVSESNGASAYDSLSADAQGNVYGTSGALSVANTSQKLFKLTGLLVPDLEFAPAAYAGGYANKVLPPIKVLVGNSPSTTSVTIALGAGSPSGGSLSGTLTEPVRSGVATFSGLTISQPGANYSFVATSGSLQATTQPFSIGPLLGEPSYVPEEVMPNQPFALTIDVGGASGKTDTGYSGSVTLSVVAGPAVLGGDTTATAINGVANFIGLTLSNLLDNDCELQAIAPGAPPLTISTPIDVASQVTLTWTGKVSQYWSNPDNWENDNGDPEAPDSNGDYLVFPADAVRLASDNNIADLQVASLDVEGNNVVNGSPITVGALTTDAGDPTLNATINFATSTAAATVRPLDASATPVTISVGDGKLDVKTLTGNDNCVKQGTGTLLIAHDPSYTGTTTLQAGTLLLLSAPKLQPNMQPPELDIAPTDGGTVTLAAVSALSLPDTLHFQGNTQGVGGTLDIVGPITFTGTLSVDNNSTLVVPTEGAVVKVNGTGGLVGNATLTLQGPGSLYVNAPLTANVSVGTSATSDVPASLGLGPKLSGQGGTITILGGVLVSLHANSFQGDIVFDDGEIEAKVSGAMGTGNLQLSGVKPVSLDPMGNSITLANPVQFIGGTLEVQKGAVDFTGTLFPEPSGEIDPATGALVTLGDILGDASDTTLTVGGTGVVALTGHLSAGLNVQGIVHLAGTLSGTGPLTMNSVDAQLVSVGVPKYTGAVTIGAGTVQFGATPTPMVSSALGTGTLSLGGAGQTVVIESEATNAYVANSMVMVEGGTLLLQPGASSASNVRFQASIGLAQPTTVDESLPDPSSNVKFTLSLLGGLNGPGELTVSGGIVFLATGLGTDVTANAGGTVIIGSNLAGSAPITINGGTLVGQYSNVPYLGVITMNSGKIELNNAPSEEGALTNPLGTGALVVQAVNEGATMNAGTSATLGNDLELDGGTFEIVGPPITFSNLSSVDLNGGTLSAFGIVNFAGAVTLAGTLINSGSFFFTNTTDGVTVSASQLSLGGNEVFSGPVTFTTSTTTVSLADSATVGFKGGISASQPVQITVSGDPKHVGKLVLSSNIGTTRMTAGTGSAIVLLNGFSESDGGKPSVSGTGKVIDDRTKT